jgi:glycosyltransferase involved in cell wall biosynthesis
VKVLFFNRCYWPDVEATGQLLTELCSDLAGRHGHDVTVVAGRPNVEPPTGAPGHRIHALTRPHSYRLFEYEVHEGVQVVRVGSRRFAKTSFWSRAVGLASYLVLALWAGLRQRRPDVLVVETDPPLLGALGAVLKRWHRCRLIYYLQDLYPEVGLALGRLRPGPIVWLLSWATQLGLRHADRVVVLGEDMRQRVLERGVASRKVAVVPNWADTGLLRPDRSQTLRQEWGLDGRFTVMYSGNLGLSQNLEKVLEGARALRREPLTFLFVGDGAAKPGLVAKATDWSLDNVRFFPYQPKEQLAQSLQAADLQLVPLQGGLAGCLVPSKLYGIMACGLPYLAMVDADSEVARVTRAGDCGLLVPPDEPEELAAALRWCLEHRAELDAMGRRGRQLAESQFDRVAAVAKFEAVLNQVGLNRDD